MRILHCRNGFTGRMLALAAALVCGVALCSQGAHAEVTRNDGFGLGVSYPNSVVKGQPFKVTISYNVEGDDLKGPGTAKVVLFNVKTKEQVADTASATLSKGPQKVEFTWGAEQTQAIATGTYAVNASLKDADGKVLGYYIVSAPFAYDETAMMIDVPQLTEDAKQFVVWQKEIDDLEAKAKALGVDTSREHVLSVVLQQANFWMGEDLKFKWYEVLALNYQFLSQKVPEVEAELKAMIANPKAYQEKVDIRLPKDRYKINGQYFYAGDKPTILIGPNVFPFTRPYIPVIHEFGYNVIADSWGPGDVFPTSEEPDGPALHNPKNPNGVGDIMKLLDDLNANGMKVDLGLTLHLTIPKWFFQKYPAARNNSPNHMMPYDIEDPATIKLTQDFLDTIMKQIARNPALNSIWLVNEAGYMNPNERDLVLFRPWVMQKYGTMDAVNKAWGTTLQSLDDVKAPKGGNIPDGITTPAATADWIRFSNDRMTAYLKMQADIIHKYDPTLPVSVKLSTSHTGYRGITDFDAEKTYSVMDVMGYDGTSAPMSKGQKDIYRSLYPDKPMTNYEFHFGWLGCSSELWEQVMDGNADVILWCWHPRQDFSSIPDYSEALYQSAITNMNVQRLTPEIVAFNKMPRAPMAMLYPNPVEPYFGEYFEVSDMVNDTLSNAGYGVDYVSESEAAKGGINKYRILILPSADYINDVTYKKVVDFVKGGGTLITLGSLPDHDEMGKPRDDSALKPQGTTQKIAAGGENAYKFSVGKGTVYQVGTVKTPPIWGERWKQFILSPVVNAFMESALSQAAPRQPVVIRNCENRTIAYKDGKGQTVYLTYLVNYTSGANITVTPKFNVDVKAAEDLISGRKVNPQKFVIPPKTAMMVKFTLRQ